MVNGKRQMVNKKSRKIAVKVKSFVNPSPLTDSKITLGQYEIYKVFLEVTDPGHQLYLSVCTETFNELFEKKAYQLIIKQHQLPFIVVDVETEEIIEWMWKLQ
jgi:hypothetical protein